MFYYKNWELFCERLSKSGIKLCTAEESLKLATGTKFIVLKHDVETFVPNAHKLAAIEHKYGICGSYYVQAYLMNNSENIQLLKEMKNWGHEISYHYDVLDANSGDYVKAEKDFRKNMDIFKKEGFIFNTICQHGNPVKKRIGYTSNRDFFRNNEIRKKYPNLVDMVVNYSQISVSDYKYISDASYKWNVITEPETNDIHPDVKNIRIGDFNNLLSLIENDNCSFVISTHPHRWMKSALRINLKILIFRFIKNIVIVLRKVPGIEAVLNQFYFLAKKI